MSEIIEAGMDRRQASWVEPERDLRRLIARAFRRARAEAEMNQSDFAKELGQAAGATTKVTRTMIAEYEAGTVTPRATLLVAAGRVSQTGVDWLLREPDEDVDA